MVVLLHASITPNAVPACLDSIEAAGHALSPLMTVLLFLILEYRPRIDHAQQEVEYILSNQSNLYPLLQTITNILRVAHYLNDQNVENHPYH